MMSHRWAYVASNFAIQSCAAAFNIVESQVWDWLLQCCGMMQYHDTETMVDGLENNTKRYINIMSEAADAAMPQPSSLDFEDDTFDILYKQVSSHLFSLHPLSLAYR